jgi:hypothetical protein
LNSGITGYAALQFSLSRFGAAQKTQGGAAEIQDFPN